MQHLTLPLCLLAILIPGLAWGAPAAKKAATPPQEEKVVLALLGQIGTEKPARVKRARRLLAIMDDAHKLRPLAIALGCKPASLRRYAAAELARLGEEKAVPALLKSALHDGNASVRLAAVKALRQLDCPSTVVPLGRALQSRSSTLRHRAAEALGELGDALAWPYLIQRWQGRSGDFTQVHFTQVRQVSYIQDFDVEVASTSFIADPIVGVLQPGLVHRVKIVATEQIETTWYRASLMKLAGKDLGPKLGAWQAHWDAHKKRLLAKRVEHFRTKR
jgi:hypothetical protein